MKRYITLWVLASVPMLAALGLHVTGNTPEPTQAEKAQTHVDRRYSVETYRGHEVWVRHECRNRFGFGGIMHSPDCPCQK